MKMNRSLLLGLALAVSLVLVLLSYHSRPAIAQPANQASKFEYCALGQEILAGKIITSFEASGKNLKPGDWQDMCKKLGTEEPSLIGTMNFLGNAGWELVSVDYELNKTVWYFKRQH
jgi:hypothetical protein